MGIEGCLLWLSKKDIEGKCHFILYQKGDFVIFPLNLSLKFDFVMKRYIVIFILSLCLASCGQHSKHWETILSMEAIIEERPDSVLNVLQAIDIEELSSDEERAKHALLLSMALDKNYIDKTDFEVLQSAIDYYESHGSPTDQMRTKFYEGRIYQNSGENTPAMSCFIEAIELGDESTDLRTQANTYYALARIYDDLYTFDKSCEYILRAAVLFDAVNKPNNAFDCWATALNGYTLAKKYEEAEKAATECKKRLPNVGYNQQVYYYRAYLHYLPNVDPIPIDEINNAIDIYCSLVPDLQWDYMTLINAYIEIGNYDKALTLVNQWEISEDNDILNVKKYHIHSYQIYKHKGDYEKALQHFEEYTKIDEEQRYTATLKNVQFMEEKHTLEKDKAKETEAKNKRTIAILVCIVALMGSLLIILIIRRRLQQSRIKNRQLESEKTHYEKMYMEVLSERNALNDMLANSAIREETMEIIKKRLGVLNTIIVSHLSEKGTDVKRANYELEKLIADRNDFIQSTRLTLEENYPYFFTYLHEKGLEEYEIDFCCLYAIGMKGKEIKTYANLSRHYKDSSVVRQKLGLIESDTNLSIFLQKLLKNEVE